MLVAILGCRATTYKQALTESTALLHSIDVTISRDRLYGGKRREFYKDDQSP